MTPQNFLDTIRVFGEPDIPDTADPATVFQSYLRALAKYGPDVLQQAADRIAATRRVDLMISVRDQLLFYELEHGTLPRTLAEMVPKYVRADQLVDGEAVQ